MQIEQTKHNNNIVYDDKNTSAIFQQLIPKLEVHEISRQMLTIIRFILKCKESEI